MSLTPDDISLENLRKYRDKQLVEGRFSGAQTTQRKIEERIGQPDQTAALSEGRDRRLHAEIDDLDELKQRRDDAEMFGFERLASKYDERIAALEEKQKDEAALSEQEETRTALAAPDDETLAKTEAALGASDVVASAERGQSPPQYVFDAYGIDPRDYDDEYELRSELRDATAKRLKSEDEEVSKERAALGINDRADLDGGGQTAAGLIRDRYGLDPSDYDDAEELRDAITEQGGYKSGVTDTSKTNFSALSANRKNGDS